MHRNDCKHPSALCTLRYQTPDRNVEETVWNSRDQAVPDTIKLGKLELKHSDAHRDEFKPYHVPRPGTRMWVNPLLDKAEAAAAEHYATHQHDEGFAAEYGETEREALAKLTAKFAEEFGKEMKGEPVLALVTSAHAARITAALVKRGAR